MINQFPPKRGRHSSKLSGTLLLIASLLIYAAPATLDAEEGTPAASDANVAPCKGLKPFNNLDELLYQFYINLDSDCLFKMPVAELEKIWGIKILSDERAQPKQYARLKDSYDFRNKPYKSESDAFYIEMYRGKKTNKNVFQIHITKDYFNKHATLFPNGNFPMLLPKPLKKDSIKEKGCQPGEPYPKNRGEYILISLYTYYWLNSAQTRMIYLTGLCGITGITILNEAIPSFIQ